MARILDYIVLIPRAIPGILAGLAFSPLMSPVLALTLLAAFLLVSAESYLAAHAVGVFRLSFLGIGPTELRIALAAGAVLAARTPFVAIANVHVRLFDVAGAIDLGQYLRLGRGEEKSGGRSKSANRVK